MRFGWITIGVYTHQQLQQKILGPTVSSGDETGCDQRSYHFSDLVCWIYIWFQVQKMYVSHQAVLALLHDWLFCATFYALARNVCR